MTDQRAVRDRVLELFVFAPAGVVRKVRDDLPGLVAAGRREVENRVRVAHWVGEMAVTYGLNEVRRRLDEQAPSTVDGEDEDETLTAAPPFDGFDELPALELVQLLPRFPAAELEIIRAYEAQQRARRTVLAKLDQLLGV
ncbi:MAG: hypothetical protein HY826_09260 [Actinobacteria bacterium]|nr:hypothetical protein [Actinomycetota bacterium]